MPLKTWRFLILSLALIALPLAAQAPTLLRRISAPTSGGAGHQFGYSVAAIPDADGDGRDDYAVGWYGTSSSQGRILVYSGRTGQVIFDRIGPSSGASNYGRSLSGCGDTNGDGRAEVLIGYFNGADLRSGADESLLAAQNCNSNFSRCGEAVTDLGDVNGDGRADYAVSAPQFDIPGGFNEGRVWVFSGLDGSVLHEIHSTTQAFELGTSLDAAGDLNGDGVPDIIVGSKEANNGDGAVAAYALGGAFVASSLFEISGTANDGALGASVGGLGDIDGDGRPEVVVGEPGFNGDAGRVLILNDDGTILDQILGSGSEEFGYAVAAAGDMNVDGIDEIIVGAPRFGGASNSSTYQQGRVLIYSGADRSRLAEQIGQGRLDWFGISVDAAGDVNGDGFDDVIAGATEFLPTGSGQPRGKGYVELLTLARYPGSGESLQVESGFPGQTDVRDVKEFAGGDVIRLEFLNDDGSLNGASLYSGVEIFVTGNYGGALLPDFYLDPTRIFYPLSGFSGSIFGVELMNPDVRLSLPVPINAGIPIGTSLLFQAALPAFGASNGYMSTNAHEFRFGRAAIHVSPSGSANGDGSQGNPLDSINGAVAKAQSVGIREIRIATGHLQ